MASFFNQASLSYGNTVTNSNITEGQTIDVGIFITKTALVPTYGEGDTVSYLVNINNTSSTASAPLTVTDNLGSYIPEGQTTALTPLTYLDGSVLYYSNGTPQAAPTVDPGPPLTISGITITAGGYVTLIYSATVNGYAPLSAEGSITNTVTVPDGSETASAEATVTAAQTLRLTIAKAICPQVIDEGGNVTYTFIIQNYGNLAAVATDNLVVTDNFTPALQNLTVTLDGAPLALDTGYTYDQLSGAFATTEGTITVPAATYTQDPVSGIFTVTPGVATLTVSGNISA